MAGQDMRMRLQLLPRVKTPSHQNGYDHSQAKDCGGIELERRLKNEAVKEASVKGHYPKMATDLRERASVFDVAAC